MWKTALGLLSFWSGVALTAMLVLQAAPVTGPVMSAAGSAYVAGWLIHICLLSLLLDSLSGRLPLALALLPLLAYGGYYLAYWDQGRQIDKRGSELRASNPTKVLAFDEKSYSLVMDRADVFAASHDVRIVYSHDKSYQPEDYVSYRLAPAEQIDRLVKSANFRTQILSVFWNDVVQAGVRELRAAGRPKGRIVTVATHDSSATRWSDRNIGETETSISLEGKQLAVFRSAYVYRLPKFPFFTIGCQFQSAPRARKCHADFVEERQPIDSMPAGVDRKEFDDPVSIMLGIGVLSGKAIENLPANPDLDDLVVKAAPAREPRAANAAFAALRAVVDGQSPSLSADMPYAIASEPSRLAPLAAGMAKRFAELNRLDASEIPGRREQAAFLAAGLAALSRNDFAGVAEQLTEVVRGSGGTDYPSLYLRAADVGAAAFPFYRDRFLSRDSARIDRMLALLALCRFRQGDGELISTLKTQWSENVPAAKRDNNYKASLFVTLLSLGQADYLRNSPKGDSELLNSWYAALLAGLGRTEVGPNNCMPLEWPVDTLAPPNLTPSLRWSRNEWIVDNAR